MGLRVPGSASRQAHSTRPRRDEDDHGAGLYVEVELGDDALPLIGTQEVLLDSDERPVALLETVDCRVVGLADVDDRHAIDEGEGYANAHEFRVAHERFWNGYIDELRTGSATPTSRSMTTRWWSSNASRSSSGSAKTGTPGPRALRSASNQWHPE